MKPIENIAIHDANMAGTPGIVCLANESLTSAANYQEGITSYIQGVMGTDLASLQNALDFFAPPVETGRLFEYHTLADGLAFLADQNDARAPGADFRRVETKGGKEIGKTTNRGLSYTIDRDAVPVGPNTVNNTAAWLMGILLRNDVLRAIGVVDGAATNQAKTWNAAANPDGDLRAAQTLSLTDRGMAPNRIAFGLTAWNTRASSYESSTKAGALMLAERSPDEVATKLGIAAALLSDVIYKTKKSGAKALAMSNIVYMFYGDAVAHEMDASNVKRFWSSCDGGAEWAVYVDESNPKRITVTVEHYSTIACTDTTGIRKLTIS